MLCMCPCRHIVPIVAVAARRSADPHRSHVALAGHKHNISFISTACLPGPSITHLALAYEGLILWHDASVLNQRGGRI